ncbi:MAG: hypothetical protein SWX82_04365, partial [Cyanobacteriota bacterium]|nr:hypothetical protein [Cyanobacteriota bacterium]
MATILFWNVNKKSLIEEVVFLCHHHQVDILILAELEVSEMEILKALNTDTEDIYLVPSNFSQKLFFFSRYPVKSIVPIRDEGGVAIRQIYPPLGC